MINAVQCKEETTKDKKTLWLGKSCLRWLNTSSSHFLSVSVTRSTYIPKKQIQCIHMNMATCFCLNKNLAFVFNMFGLVKSFTNDLNNVKPKGSRFNNMTSHWIDQTQWEREREKKRDKLLQLSERHQRRQPRTDLAKLRQTTTTKSEKEANQRDEVRGEWTCLYHCLPFSMVGGGCEELKRITVCVSVWFRQEARSQQQLAVFPDRFCLFRVEPIRVAFGPTIIHRPSELIIAYSWILITWIIQCWLVTRFLRKNRESICLDIHLSRTFVHNVVLVKKLSIIICSDNKLDIHKTYNHIIW